MPPQLLELQLNSSCCQERQQPLDLRHLAAATALTLLRAAVNEGDALPPNLLRLSTDRISFKPTTVVPQSSLPALTQLTALCFTGPLSDLQHVPPQLLELQLNTSYHQHQQPLDLGHLAAATALTVLRVLVSERDVLPPNLLRLQLNNCRSVQPLLPLVQLQQLDVDFEDEWQEDFTDDQLRQLSRLTALGLDLGHQIEPASADAWPALPLQQVALEVAILSGPVCQCLAQLSGLTSLALFEFQLPQAGSAQQLAAALRQLSGLQHLQLQHPLWVADVITTQERADMGQQLLQAVGSLQQLRALDMCSFKELAAAAAASSSLSVLTHLTGLSLAWCDLSDAAMLAIISQLPWLQSLDCSFIHRLTVAVLPAIGQLQQLTELKFVKLGFGREARAELHYLSGLTRLERLSLSCSSVADGGVCHLTVLTRLRELGRGCSSQQAKWLQQRLPHLTRICDGRERW